MASFIARRAFSTTARRFAAGEEALKQESKRNPELIVRKQPTGSRGILICHPGIPGDVGMDG